MGIRTFRPTTSTRRIMANLDWSELTNGGHVKPTKSLLESQKQTGGRNNQGRTTSRFRGSGEKQMYRLVDFKRRKDDIVGTVKSIEYDPNRNANIALIEYADGTKSYVLAIKDLQPGYTIMSGDKVEPKPGNCMPLRNIPQGLEVHNIEMVPRSGGKLVRAAGMAAQLTAKEGDYCIVTLPSGEIRKIHADCRATIGMVGNLDFQNIVWGKAGRARHKGRRPHNRGTSQNPVSHPLGGGSGGRGGGGRHPCSPTGLLAKAGHTRKKKKASSAMILRGRRRGKHVSGTAK